MTWAYQWLPLTDALVYIHPHAHRWRQSLKEARGPQNSSGFVHGCFLRRQIWHGRLTAIFVLPSRDRLLPPLCPLFSFVLLLFFPHIYYGACAKCSLARKIANGSWSRACTLEKQTVLAAPSAECRVFVLSTTQLFVDSCVTWSWRTSSTFTHHSFWNQLRNW